MFFIKKDVLSKPIRVIFYDGNLPGFISNMPCQLLFEERHISVRKINPEVVVNLNNEKLCGIEMYLKESDYMIKYHGQAVSTTKTKGIEKMYFVLVYQRNETLEKYAFWGTAMEFRSVRIAYEKLSKQQTPATYNL